MGPAAIIAAGFLLFGAIAQPPVPASAGDPGPHAQVPPTATPVPPEDQYQGDTSNWPYFALATAIPIGLFLAFLALFRKNSRNRP
ncbi:MAG: hypothetical protein ACSLFM_04675 [Tepidiformaceae bacterium]